VRPGDVTIEVVAVGHRPWRGRAQVKLGELTRVSAILDRVDGAIADPNLVYRAEPSSDGSSMKTAGWAMTGIGIGVVVVGGVMTTLAQLDQRTFDSASVFSSVDLQTGQTTQIRQDMTQSEAEDLKKRAETYELASIISYSVGGAALLTGVILLAVDPGGDSGALAGGRLDIAPIPAGGMMSYTLPFY
jgi:hypothetical protein